MTDTASWNGDSGNRRFMIAFVCAAVLEVGAVGGVLIASGAPKPVDDGPRAPFRIAIQVPPTPAPPPPTPQPPTPPILPPPQAVPRVPAPIAQAPAPPVPAPSPRAPVPAPHARRQRHHEPPPRPIEPSVAAPTTRPSPPSPPSPPQPATPSANDTATFEAALRRAVQASLIFPAGAQAAHEQGVAHVRFAYRDGMVSNAVLIGSTGFPILDAAALQTVRDARYPAPTAAFAGRTLSVDVAVVFRAAESSMESD